MDDLSGIDPGSTGRLGPQRQSTVNAFVPTRRLDGRYELRAATVHIDPLSRSDQLTDEMIPDGTPLRRSPVPVSHTVDDILERYVPPHLYDVVCLVSTDSTVKLYAVWWLDWGPESERETGSEATDGVLVAVDSVAELLDARHWFRTTKRVLFDVVQMGRLTERAARVSLEARVCEELHGYRYTYTGYEHLDRENETVNSRGCDEFLNRR